MTRILVVVHAGLATATGTPELAIDAEEGGVLAGATVNMLAEFDITPDPRTQAIIGFVVACASVYGPRVYVIRARKAQQAREHAAGADGVGTAGVYGADGAPAGTTEFKTD
jgi:hypothetical protein